MKTLSSYYSKTAGRAQELKPTGPLLGAAAMAIGKVCQVNAFARYLGVNDREIPNICRNTNSPGDKTACLLAERNAKVVTDLAQHADYYLSPPAARALRSIQHNGIRPDPSFGDKTLFDLFPDELSVVRFFSDELTTKNPYCLALLLGYCFQDLYDLNSSEDSDIIKSRNILVDFYKKCGARSTKLAHVIPVLCRALEKTDNIRQATQLRLNATQCRPAQLLPAPEPLATPPDTPDQITALHGSDALKPYLNKCLLEGAGIWPICLGMKWDDVEKLHHSGESQEQKRCQVIRHWVGLNEKPLQQFFTGNLTLDLWICSRVFNNALFQFSPELVQKELFGHALAFADFSAQIRNSLHGTSPTPEPSDFQLLLISLETFFKKMEQGPYHFGLTNVDINDSDHTWQGSTSCSFSAFKTAIEKRKLKNRSEYQCNGLSTSEALMAAAISNRDIYLAEHIAMVTGYPIARIKELKAIYENDDSDSLVHCS